MTSWTLVPITANWGRGVSASEFRANVLRVLDASDKAVLCIQELDEADAPDEHAILAAAIHPKDARIGWHTYEPIVVPWMLQVRNWRATKACRGLAKYTPTRFIVEALISNPDRTDVPAVVVMNQHPPINRPATQSRRRRQRRVHKRRIRRWVRRGVTVVWAGDMNDANYPRMHRAERTAVHRGLDYIRYVQAPGGAQVEVLGHKVIPQTIDGHDALLARLRLTPPKEKP